MTLTSLCASMVKNIKSRLKSKKCVNYFFHTETEKEFSLPVKNLYFPIGQLGLQRFALKRYYNACVMQHI